MNSRTAWIVARLIAGALVCQASGCTLISTEPPATQLTNFVTDFLRQLAAAFAL